MVKASDAKKSRSFGCYLCGSSQPNIRDCTKSQQLNPKRQIQCYSCKAYGHLSFQCDQKKTGFHKAGAMNLGTEEDVESEEDEGHDELDHRGLVDRQEDASHMHACNRSDHGDITFSCGCKLPTIASASSTLRSKNMSTRMGKINGEMVE